VKLKYTLLTAELFSETKRIDLPFALVFENNGVYRVEVSYQDDNFFEEEDFQHRFTLKGKTEKGWEIECSGLWYSRYIGETKKAEFRCHDKVRLENNKREHEPDEENDRRPFSKRLHFIEIDGFEVVFGDHTRTERLHNTGKVRDFNNVEWDHSSCALTINHPKIPENYFHLNFYKSKSSGNTIIDFTKTEGYGKLLFEEWKLFKEEFVSFLSFLNGADVRVIRELTGHNYQDEAKDAQLVYTYSLPKLGKRNHDGYIPINEYHSYSSNIFSLAFIQCFDKYYQQNKIFDFVSLVRSLNNSTNTTRYEEGYYILITALERISLAYYRSNNPDKATIINDSLLSSKVISELQSLLASFKSELNEEAPASFEIMKSRIGNLNRRKNDVGQKLYEFLSYSQIPLNENVEKLIETERHMAVHEGEIGHAGEEKTNIYWKLDNILRDSILNLIGYSSYRKRRYRYATDEELKAVNLDGKKLHTTTGDTL